MGLFLRKSIKVGKFGRINFSKSGVGFSVGVKGARIGKSSTGKTYVAGGRKGIYFRKQLSNKTNNKTNNNEINEATKKASNIVVTICFILVIVVTILVVKIL